MPTRIAIAVVQREGRFLVGQRGGDVPLAGQAEFPGGKVHVDETVEAAAVRECLEETGLQVRPLRALDVIHHVYDHATVELHFVACQLCDGISQPIAPFRWVDRSELSALHFPAANARVIRSLMAVGVVEGRS